MSADIEKEREKLNIEAEILREGNAKTAKTRTEETKAGDSAVDKLSKRLEAPADFTSPDVLYDELIAAIRRYHPSDDISMVEKAYKIARDAHKDQRRKSGEPYIIHPLCVAIILADLELDKESLVAGILHDVVEDTIMTDEEIAHEFGDEVALLVEGVTKLTQISWSTDKVEIQGENLRKMFLAMAKDIRVILIKLADRLHNMRTLQYMKPEKQKEKARETMDIYAPIANRLGISKIKVELDDLSLKYLQPDVYQELENRVISYKKLHEGFIQGIAQEVQQHMDAVALKAHVEGKPKHFFTIYKKMVTQDKTLDQIYDLFVVRITVDTVKDCYAALGVIHEMYKPIPGKFKDYIAMPKPNRYQSLHTTLISNDGQPFKIQIRTYEMDRIAQLGIASEWKYKEDGSGQSAEDSEEQKLTWLRQILEWQKDMSDNKEFVSLLKSDLDLFSESVYCFTPSGDVKNLPNGSTAIDFAYSIHSAVGNKMVGAKVNGKQVPVEYVIQNGDRVEILTSNNSSGPSREWLNTVRSTQAKSKINQWFRTEFKEENIVKGRELLTLYCEDKNVDQQELLQQELMEKVMDKYGFKDWDSVLAAVGHGGLKEGQVINKLIEEKSKKQRKESAVSCTPAMLDGLAVKLVSPSGLSRGGIMMKGLHELPVRFSRCCNPVPGDEIVGFVTSGRGLSVHRTDCANILSLSDYEKTRLIDVEWQHQDPEMAAKKFAVEIEIHAANRIGLFVDISKIFTERQLDITSMNVRTNKQGIASIVMTFDISDTEELNSLTDRLKRIDGVKGIERTTG